MRFPSIYLVLSQGIERAVVALHAGLELFGLELTSFLKHVTDVTQQQSTKNTKIGFDGFFKCQKIIKDHKGSMFQL